MRKESNVIFTLIRKLHIGIAFVLLLLFFAPFPVKIADILYHHHYDSLKQKSPETGYNLPSTLCPIPGFKFHSFTFQVDEPKLEGSLFLHTVDIFNTLETYFSPYVLSFSLRGPPLSDIFS
ncbi:MAG: hypothetical protein JXR65_02945 [Bacteroidales bacterium]|nr:hypothetical protein [Bacteroidales bacterium]